MTGNGQMAVQNATIIKFGVMDLFKDFLMTSSLFSCLSVIAAPIAAV